MLNNCFKKYSIHTFYIIFILKDMNHHHGKIQQAIKLLQETLGNTSISQETTAPIGGSGIPGIQQHIKQFTSLSQKLQPQIQQLNSIFAKTITLMNAIVAHSSNCKKFSPQEQQKLKLKFMNFNKETEKVQKNQAFIPHAKAIRQLISATFWVFVNSPSFILQGGIQAADFNALKFKTKKVIPHNEWYNSIVESVKSIQLYVKKNCPTGLTFNSAGSGSWNDLNGDTILSSSPNQSQPKQKTEQVNVAPKQTPKKAPRKQISGLNWDIANFEGQQIVISENDVTMKQGIFIENCKQCVVKILGKFKSLLVNNCQNIAVIVGSSISGLEVINSQNVQLQVTQKTPSISIDKCNKVKVTLNGDNMNCDVVSSKASELNVTYIKNGNEAKSYLVGQQLITKWNPEKNKFETSIYDKFL